MSLLSDEHINPPGPEWHNPRLCPAILHSEDKHAYLQSGEWQGKAGGYAIQGRAGLYVRQITGSYSNIVGMDMHKVAGLLLGAGFDYVLPE